MAKMESVCVVGLGYIGLPTASLLATKGFKVFGVDTNPTVVSMISQGKIHIYEPDLDILVKSAVQSGNLNAFSEPVESDVFIIAVPTPFKDGFVPDLAYVESAVRTLAPKLKPGNLVILESTSPVGTTENIATWLRKYRPDLRIPSWRGHLEQNTSGVEQIYLAHCPERVLPGNILRELVDNHRVIGGLDQASTEKAKTFYEAVSRGKLLLTDSRTAEMTKLIENSYRDVNIAFANELSLICDKLKINTWELISLANHHPRVNILSPGPGVGGHCIAVDPWFVVHSSPEEAKLIRTAREVNTHKTHYVVNKIIEKCEKFKNPVVACLGLSYKADIDDLRESPAVDIALEISKKNLGSILVVEPHVSKLPAQFDSLSSSKLTDLKTAVNDADILVLLVNHREFLEVDRTLLKEKIVIDTRGVWS